MSPRRLALVSIAVVTVLAVIGVAVLAVAAGGSAMAYKVNGNRVSQQTVDDQLHDLANSNATKTVSQTPGTVDSTTTARLLNTNIIRDLLQGEAQRKGIELSDRDRTVGEATASSSVGANYSKLPASYRDLLVSLYGYANALGLKTSDALNTFLTRAIKQADVHVDAKYGFWNPKYGVCPPTGCASLATPSSGSSG
jgi:hypothetical protein